MSALTDTISTICSLVLHVQTLETPASLATLMDVSTVAKAYSLTKTACAVLVEPDLSTVEFVQMKMALAFCVSQDTNSMMKVTASTQSSTPTSGAVCGSSAKTTADTAEGDSTGQTVDASQF